MKARSCRSCFSRTYSLRHCTGLHSIHACGCHFVPYSHIAVYGELSRTRFFWESHCRSEVCCKMTPLSYQGVGYLALTPTMPADNYCPIRAVQTVLRHSAEASESRKIRYTVRCLILIHSELFRVSRQIRY